MSLLARARLCARKCRSSLYPISALQQFHSFATKTTQKSPNPRTLRSTEQPSSISSQRQTKQTESLPLWPKPKEIPYQAKVANFVNLIGFVEKPVRFEASPDGKHFSTTLISQQNTGDKNSLLIPVVFGGDLAHVAACHVKENDCVFVSGVLSVNPKLVELSDSLGKFHIVAENLNFVEGFKRNVARVSFSSVELEKPEVKKSEEVENDDAFTEQWKAALRAKGESHNPPPKFDANAKVITPERVESVGSKKNECDNVLNLWRDLVKNPLQWWDYRDHKSNGLVKEKYPDFKQKATGEGLWLNSAPDWVLPGLGKLEFDVKVIRQYQAQGSSEVRSVERKSDGSKGEESWRNLVEYPNKWWDNRVGKRYPNGPDFKHKETGEALWLRDVPDWASSRLPPLRELS